MAELQQCGWYRFIARHICAVQHKRTGVYGMSVLNLLSSAWAAFADWRRRERAYDELMALDDHALADIGIRRSDIRAICEGSYARHPSVAFVAPGCEKFTSPEARLVWP